MMCHKDIRRCLKYIKVYLEEGDNSASRLRGFLDEWYGYSKGGSHLTRSNNVRWLNNPDYTNPVIRDCLEGMDFVSLNARKVLNGDIDGRLVKEHAVPVKILRLKLKEISSPSIAEIQTLLEKFYRLGVLTKDEDYRIDAKGLTSSMPDDWDEKDMFARYSAAGIE